MTKRLALVIVGVVITTLLLAGAGTLLLSAARARTTTVKALQAQAEEMAGNIDQLLDIDETLPQAEQAKQLRNRLRLLTALRKVVAFDEISVLIIGRDGQLQGELPTSLSVDDLDPSRLQAGTTVTGNRGTHTGAIKQAIGGDRKSVV